MQIDIQETPHSKKHINFTFLFEKAPLAAGFNFQMIKYFFTTPWYYSE